MKNKTFFTFNNDKDYLENSANEKYTTCILRSEGLAKRNSTTFVVSKVLKAQFLP